jgi:hypothetical protein
MRKTCLSILVLVPGLVALLPVHADARSTSHRYAARHYGHHGGHGHYRQRAW